MVKKLFRIMLPSQILSSIAMAVCMQIDNIMIGRYIGVEALSAYGLVTPLLFILTAIAGLIAAGVSALCARLAGKNDKDGICNNYSSTIVLCLILSVVFTTALLLLAGPVADFLGASVEAGTLSHAVSYIKGYAVGLPFYFFLQAFMSYLQISGKRRRVSTAILAMVAADIICDILAGVLSLGMFGMAAATSISEFAAFLCCLGFFLRKDSDYKFSIKKFSFKEIFNVLETGASLAVNQACFTVLVYIVNKLLLTYGGTNAVAAYSVISSVSTFCFTLSNGVGGVTQILSGVFYGEEDKKGLCETLSTALKYVLVMTVIAAILVFIFSKSIVILFIGEGSEAVPVAVKGLCFYIASIIPCGVSAVFKSLYQGENKVLMSVIITAVQNLVAPSLFMLGLSSFFGLTGIWCGFFAGEIIAMLVYLLTALIKNKKISIESCLLAPKGFGVSNDRILDLTIKKPDDVSVCSEQAGNFCKAFGQNSKTCNYVALCVEEMACETIFNAAFVPGKNSIFVRLVRREDMWVMRISDDCAAYDATNYAKLSEGEDRISHLGVRMIFKMVTDAKYMNRLGFNNLTLFLKA